ncbi:MAG TPA: heavy-metal-associated domain-containing protein [Cytophagaceae bacterium]|nr:heavy-metal-associated domain-containing protein [Cytophagaceae bacterium]
MKNSKNILAMILMGLIAVSCHQQNAKQADFYVRGNCGMCKERIEKSAMAVSGVEKADWNVETKNLMVSYDTSKVNELKIQQAVANSGHETKSISSPTAVHDALPECCKKNSSM